MIDMFLKLSGLGWTWDKVDGAKTYIAGVGGILSGLAMVCTGLAGLISEFLPLHGWGAVLAWGKTLGSDASFALLAKGWAAVLAGLSVVGLRHAIDKNTPDDPPATPPATPAPAPGH